MRKTHLNKWLALILCMVLIAVTALLATGCGDKADNNPSSGEVEGSELGEGDTQFDFVVVDGDGNETDFTINTDEETVGAALLELDLIAGEDSEFGLYVKTVNGITADYDTDGTYWAFYVNDEYASTGVDSTEVEAGAEYAFKVEK